MIPNEIRQWTDDQWQLINETKNYRVFSQTFTSILNPSRLFRSISTIIFRYFSTFWEILSELAMHLRMPWKSNKNWISFTLSDAPCLPYENVTAHKIRRLAGVARPFSAHRVHTYTRRPIRICSFYSNERAVDAFGVGINENINFRFVKDYYYFIICCW